MNGCITCSAACRRPGFTCTARESGPAARSATSTSWAAPAARATTTRTWQMCGNGRPGPHTGCRTPSGPTDGVDMTSAPRPRVGVIMGSDSDWSVMEDAARALAEFDVPFEVGVVSAHRTPARMLDYAQSAAGRGIEVIIAGAGGAAHLPGMVASATPLPVIGVPVPLDKLEGLDSLLSIVQMPATSDAGLRQRVEAFQQQLEASVLEKDAALRDRLLGE